MWREFKCWNWKIRFRNTGGSCRFTDQGICVLGIETVTETWSKTVAHVLFKSSITCFLLASPKFRLSSQDRADVQKSNNLFTCFPSSSVLLCASTLISTVSLKPFSQDEIAGGDHLSIFLPLISVQIVAMPICVDLIFQLKAKCYQCSLLGNSWRSAGMKEKWMSRMFIS